jgi:hypothetical protein
VNSEESERASVRGGFSEESGGSCACLARPMSESSASEPMMPRDEPRQGDGDLERGPLNQQRVTATGVMHVPVVGWWE